MEKCQNNNNKDRLTDRLTDRQIETDRQTDRQTDRLTDRQNRKTEAEKTEMFKDRGR